MAHEVIECAEFDEIELGITKLLRDGVLELDERVHGRGYFNVSIRDGHVVLRADRHVGLIPLNRNTSVRVRPRTSIANLSYMLVRSGVTPTAIADFDRGYLPRFEAGQEVEKLYGRSLLVAVERVIARGLLKSYSRVEDPPQWRGRFLASDTIRRHRARGVKYRHEFEVSALSVASVENIALKVALQQVRKWIARSEPTSSHRQRIDQLLHDLRNVPEWQSPPHLLVRELGRRVMLLPKHLGYYRESLWTAFVLLQSKIPKIELDGSVRLDSLIVDVSKVFESYVRLVVRERAAGRGWTVLDGNSKPTPLFVEGAPYVVKPDLVICEDGKPLAVFDAKYKPEPKESDRYELMAFMDALGVQRGAFINPQWKGQASKHLGETLSRKQISLLRFDLSQVSMEREADCLFANIVSVVEGGRSFAPSL